MRLLRKILGNYKIQILLYMSLSAFFAASFYTYNPNDTSLNAYSGQYNVNKMGFLGSSISDLMIQIFGISALLYALLPILWVRILYKKKEINYISIKILLSILSISLISTAFSYFKFSLANFSSENLIGSILLPLTQDLLGPISPFILLLLGIFTFVISSGHNLKSFIEAIINIVEKTRIPYLNLPNIQLPNFFSRNQNQQNISSEYSAPSATKPFKEPKTQSREAKSEIQKGTYKPPVGDFELPNTELLDVLNSKKVKMESESELQEKAERLLKVLNEFGVKGNITDIHQGPVVTLYEFEPSAGTKSSRVIGLADDIARSLSAISTRIAVIPGRNALGIEIPNENRQFFNLRELIETNEYEAGNHSLPIILGKDLSGAPYVVDLAKMPHLLVAGTTGSGKSVAINAMIISLLYRHTAATCKFIMIDPKMLELSVYQDIPHLLTPVVTEPAKAVVSLKWAVKEMENRYRLMSNLNVRNISGYNQRIRDAVNAGEILERTVQTGFDPETGKPIYESIQIDMEPLPFIVIIVDEMADLMLVAGKDIETSIQRLAQMARAAGIHLIMATQRPSVDVITGVIKANFPSRVSFKVTSKIDSRTILGEQGAEQLLGMGDMLYVSSSSTVNRLHGPFVDDKEVERIAKFLKAQGTPNYVTSVTEEDESTSPDRVLLDDDDSDEALYKKAVAIVKRDRKVSTSYIQRCLRIGYNRAAIIVEKMESEGVISEPNHSGKREILIGE